MYICLIVNWEESDQNFTLIIKVSLGHFLILIFFIQDDVVQKVKQEIEVEKNKELEKMKQSLAKVLVHRHNQINFRYVNCFNCWLQGLSLHAMTYLVKFF